MERQFPSPPAFHNSTMALDDAAPQLPVFFEDLRRLPPGRHSVPSEEVARQQRLRLMAGMLDAVGEQGYVATSVADVLSRAGVSRRTFYEHFSDKEDCFLQAFDHVATIGREAVGDAFRKEDGWRRAVRTGLSTFLHTAAANPRFARACLVEILAVGPEGVRRRDAATEPFQRFFAQGREQAPEGVRIPETVAETLVGGILETVSARVMRDEADRLPELLDALVYWSLVPFVGPIEAAAAPSARTGRSAGAGRGAGRTVGAR
jgi:AcrR family transcriptional regulator